MVDIKPDPLLYVLVLVDNCLQIGEQGAGICGLVLDVVHRTFFDNMRFLYTVVLSCIMHFTEHGSARLLVDRHDMSPE